MKKKLLFVIDSLGSGGAEKSLVTLLSLLDYSEYDVDLQLFSQGGEFQDFLPENVNLLPIPDYFVSVSRDICSQLVRLKINDLMARLRYSIAIRKPISLNHPERAMIFWKCTSNRFCRSKRVYDMAVAYGQGVPTFYVADKISAKKKFAWVNASLMLNDKVRKYNEEYYKKFDVVVPVSESAKNVMEQLFPNSIGEMYIVRDIVDADMIKKMSEEQIGLVCEKPMLLTVSRLNNKHKGMDIALTVCKELHSRGLDFRWYVVGDGGFRQDMERYIVDNGLGDVMILLGTKANPYPYFKACDIYVQTSRHEGFGLSIAEARMLNKPVVTTEFDAVWNQMVQGKNGIVVPLDAVAVADAVEDLLVHPEKREAISAYQRTEKKGNTEELEKFYRLING